MFFPCHKGESTLLTQQNTSPSPLSRPDMTSQAVSGGIVDVFLLPYFLLLFWQVSYSAFALRLTAAVLVAFSAAPTVLVACSAAPLPPPY